MKRHFFPGFAFVCWIAAWHSVSVADDATSGIPAASAVKPALSQQTPVQQAPVRFILTFDDGPDGRETGNSTASILASLAENPTQKNIKAIFFLQTRFKGGGASPMGQRLLAQEFAQGHVLALHDGSTLGHPNHTKLRKETLEQSLDDGSADIQSVTGRPVTLLRPPYWAFNEQTLAAYQRHGLAMLLTDISANDGKIWGYRGSPRRRSHMASEMTQVRARMQRGEIGSVDNVTPIVVTFHDTNDYTAEHLQEYLQIMIEEAQNAGLVLASPVFYDDAAALERAALMRAADAAHRNEMVPRWWRWINWLF